MSDFNKKTFKFLSNNFYASNIVQISIICCQLLIYENIALPWVVYGSITCILFKMINCVCLFMETESSDYVNLEPSHRLPDTKFLMLTILNYFLHSCFFLGVQVEMGKSFLCVEIFWDVIINTLLCGSIPLR